ncbi:MAG: hypothetical protein AB7K24_24690 [Gemmataceae bacterium]
MQLQARSYLPVFLFALTLGCVGAVFSTSGNTMFSPGDLNARARRETPLGGVRAHAEINDCAACHTAAWSNETMADRCLSCHQNVKSQLDSGSAMHGRLDNGLQCRSCHTEHKGPHATVTDLTGFNHDHASFPLTGKHMAVECRACHRDELYRGTASTCVSCHEEPQVHLNKFGTNCEQCHQTLTWKGASIGPGGVVSFDHASTGFPLTGKHTSTDCKSCHVNNTFKGTSRSCVSCHAEPKAHLGKFGTECAGCHSTTTWKGATLTPTGLVNFNHDSTPFPLTGKHTSVDCKSCHVNSVFKGTSHKCASCHAEPKVHLGKFGTECAGCHSTSTWKGATLSRTALLHFDHNTTAFKLTGKHTSVECKSCHVNNVFKGTSHTCLSCHVEPMVHKGKFGTECASCHSTTTWKGAVFAHKFPINHGNKRRTNECSTCHKTPDYKVYTCYGCHEHEKTRIARKHREVRFRAGVTLEQCAKCHGNGKEKRRAEELFSSDALLAMVDTPAACPGQMTWTDPRLDLVSLFTMPAEVRRPPVKPAGPAQRPLPLTPLLGAAGQDRVLWPDLRLGLRRD